MVSIEKTLKINADSVVHPAGKHVHTYNIVFTHHRTGVTSAQYAYCTVKTDLLLEYGSDLQALREELEEGLNLELVIISWVLLKDNYRPEGVLPSIELQPGIHIRKK